MNNYDMHVVRYCIACDVWTCEMVHKSDSVNSVHISPGHETISVEQAIEAQPVMQLIILRTTESAPATLVLLFLLMCVFFHLGEIGVLKLCKTVWNSAAHGFLSHLSTNTFVKFHHQGLSTPTEVVVAETVDLSPMLKTSSATKCQDVSGCVRMCQDVSPILMLWLSRPSVFLSNPNSEERLMLTIPPALVM